MDKEQRDLLRECLKNLSKWVEVVEKRENNPDLFCEYHKEGKTKKSIETLLFKVLLECGPIALELQNFLKPIEEHEEKK